jgi:hypothetical protein
MVYCQNCGKDTAGAGVTFYGNVLCGEACKKDLSERLYFRDTPPEPGSVWYCPHCGGQNPMGDPRKQLRPNCTQCGKPLDPASAAPPGKQGCLGLLVVALLPAGLAAAAALAACSDPPIALRPDPPPSSSPAAQPPQDAQAAQAAQARRRAQQQQQQPPPAAGEPEPPAPERSAAERDEHTPEDVVNRRMLHRRERIARGAAEAGGGPDSTPGAEGPTGPIVAVGPEDPQPQVGAFLHGAKFEPPLGRVLHGMGNWELGRESYLRALDDPALQPATALSFLPIGDWPRTWATRVTATREGMTDLAAKGYIPHLDISLFGLDAQDEQQGVDADIAHGDKYDGRVRDVARAVRSIEGPVFVRIGAEFNGRWNPYTPFEFPAAFRKIVEIFRAEGVANAAFVWCYEPDAPGDFADVDPERGPLWYPGDDVVDWFGLDVFHTNNFAGPRESGVALAPAGRCEAFLRMALEHDKPVILAESSAAFVELTPDPADGEADWAAWFAPYFEFLEANPNIEAFHYVNVDWSVTGHYGEMGWRNASIDVNPIVTERYREELRKPRYLHAGNAALLNGAAELPAAVPAPALEGAESEQPSTRRR